MHRRVTTGVLSAILAGAAALTFAAPASALAAPHIKVSPARGLKNNQTITISGSGLGRSKNGSLVTWFASECTTGALHVKKLSPGFSSFCASSLIKPLHVTPAGSFSVRFKVATGKIADGSCGVPGHMTCVIAVGTGAGVHATATVHFKNVTPPPPKKKNGSKK